MIGCGHARDGLVPFQFGALEEGARDALEAQLAACPACLAAFFALKRGVESPAIDSSEDARPSAPSAARLRSAVARELGLLPRPHGWLERGLAVSLACAAAFAALAVTHSLSTRTPTPPHSMSR